MAKPNTSRIPCSPTDEGRCIGRLSRQTSPYLAENFACGGCATAINGREGNHPVAQNGRSVQCDATNRDTIALMCSTTRRQTLPVFGPILPLYRHGFLVKSPTINVRRSTAPREVGGIGKRKQKSKEQRTITRAISIPRNYGRHQSSTREITAFGCKEDTRRETDTQVCRKCSRRHFLYTSVKADVDPLYKRE